MRDDLVPFFDLFTGTTWYLLYPVDHWKVKIKVKISDVAAGLS